MRTILLALPLLFVVACGETHEHHDGGTLHIHATEPNPPRVGQNVLKLTVHDAAHKLLSGAKVTVTPFMTAHGHGSSETPVVTDNGDGSYEASPVTLTMPGTWEITIHAQHGDDEGELVLTWEAE